MFWKGTEEELVKFLKEINEVHPTIEFDQVFSEKNVNFLDCQVSFPGDMLTTVHLVVLIFDSILVAV